MSPLRPQCKWQNEYVVSADPDKHYVDGSDAACRLPGYSGAEIPELTITDLSYQPEIAPILFEPKHSAA